MYLIDPVDKSSPKVFAGEPVHLRIDDQVEGSQYHLCILFHGAEVWLIVVPTEEDALLVPQHIGPHEDLNEVLYVWTGRIGSWYNGTTFNLGKKGTRVVLDRLIESGITPELADVMMAPRRCPGGRTESLIYWRIYP